MWKARALPDDIDTAVNWSSLTSSASPVVREKATHTPEARPVAESHESVWTLHSLPTSGANAQPFSTRSTRRIGAGAHDNYHVKSRIPLAPSCGLVYMECQILQVLPHDLGGDTTTRVASTTDPKAAPVPALVVGVCRKTLPVHRLPGEEAHGIGLFTRQRLVYNNASNQAERVAMPLQGRPPLAGGAEDHHSFTGSTLRVLTAGDVVGCLVNFFDHTVAFTVNGQLLSYLGRLDHKVSATGYYMAVGMQSGGPALRLRVLFRGGSACRTPSPTVANKFAETNTVATVFDLDRYEHRVAVALVQRKDRRLFRGNWAETRLADAAVTLLLRDYLAARGWTSTLRALDRETHELMRVPKHDAHRRSAEVHAHVLAEARRRVCGGAEQDDVLQHLWHHGILAPHLCHALAEIVGETGCETAALQTLHFFAQRQDVLYVLVALRGVVQGLRELDTALAQWQQQPNNEQSLMKKSVVGHAAAGLFHFTREVLQPFAAAHAARSRAAVLDVVRRLLTRNATDADTVMGKLPRSKELSRDHLLTLVHARRAGHRDDEDGTDVMRRAMALLLAATTPHVAAPSLQEQRSLATCLDAVHHGVWGFVDSLHTHCESGTTAMWVHYWRTLLQRAARRYARRAWTLLHHSVEDCNTQAARLLTDCRARLDVTVSRGVNAATQSASCETDVVHVTSEKHSASDAHAAALCEHTTPVDASNHAAAQNDVGDAARVADGVTHHGSTPTTVMGGYWMGDSDGDRAYGHDDVLLPPVALTLRSLWRRTHAVAVLETPQQLASNAFIEELRRLTSPRATLRLTTSTCPDNITNVDDEGERSPLKRSRGESDSVENSKAEVNAPHSEAQLAAGSDVTAVDEWRVKEFRTASVCLQRIYTYLFLR